jgi:hypothetical protein
MHTTLVPTSDPFTEALARQNPRNWAEVRAEVVGIIREEMG